jgi:hypothetical protein
MSPRRPDDDSPTASPASHEIVTLDHAAIDGREDRGIDNKGAKPLHQIERERRPSKSRLMIEPHEGIEANGVTHRRKIANQQGIGNACSANDLVAEITAEIIRRAEIDFTSPEEARKLEFHGRQRDQSRDVSRLEINQQVNVTVRVSALQHGPER